MASLKPYRSQEQGFSDILNYAAFVDDGIELNKDGSLMAAWSYSGPDVDSSTSGELEALSARINRALVRLGTGFMLHVDSMRGRSADYPHERRSFFPNRVPRWIDGERRKMFQSHDRHFECFHVICLTYMPVAQSTKRASKWMYADEGSAKMTYADQIFIEFRAKVAEFEDQLANVISLNRLRGERYEDEYGVTHIRDHFLSHLHFCITGERRLLNLPPVPMYLDAILGGRFIHGITPAINDTRIGVIAIEGFPLESWPTMLAALDQVPVTYRWSNRFIFLDALDAQSQIETYRKKWQGKAKALIDQITGSEKAKLDQDAVEMEIDARSAQSEASSNLVAYGYYTASIVIYDNDQEKIDRVSRNFARTIGNLGFVARIETLNATEAYIGSLPGHSAQNVRRPLINSINLADLLPVTGVWVGHRTNPCPFYPPNSPPLMQVATAGSTPYRINLHVGDVGHTLIFGPTGSGKSTLLSLIAAQLLRYGDMQVFCFDKGYSMMPLTLAVEGSHHDVAGDGSELAFCPLQNLDTDNDQSWANDYLETLIKLRGVKLTVDQRNAINTATGLLRSSRRRSLSDFVTSVNDKEIKQALEGYTVTGPLGHLLDSETDNLSFSNFQTFELEHLMRLGDDKVIPVLLYLFNRIERRLDGRPSAIILDEAWITLGHEVFGPRIVEWLRTLRKANCIVIMATQSVADAMNSGIIDVLTESCPTKIFLPNEAALSNVKTRLHYQNLGLNDRQIEMIAEARPKREYYMVSPEGRRVFDMELGPLTLSFVGASGKEDIARVRELHARHGSEWPIHWLRERGVDDAQLV